MKYLDRESQLNTMVHPVHTLKISDFDDDLLAQAEEQPEDKRTPRQRKKDYINNQKLDRIQLDKAKESEQLDFDKLTPEQKQQRQDAIDAVRRGDVSDEEIQEGRIRENINDGDYLRDPENLNNLMKIGGKALDLLKFIPSLMIQPQRLAKLPHTPPTEKIMLPNGKMIDSPLRFKTDEQRERFMKDFSKGFGRYQ